MSMPADAFDQTHAEALVQLANVQTDRGLGQVELATGGREIAAFDHSTKVRSWSRLMLRISKQSLSDRFENKICCITSRDAKSVFEGSRGRLALGAPGYHRRIGCSYPEVRSTRARVAATQSFRIRNGNLLSPLAISTSHIGRGLRRGLQEERIASETDVSEEMIVELRQLPPLSNRAPPLAAPRDQPR